MESRLYAPCHADHAAVMGHELSTRFASSTLIDRLPIRHRFICPSTFIPGP